MASSFYLLLFIFVCVVILVYIFSAILYLFDVCIGSCYQDIEQNEIKLEEEGLEYNKNGDINDDQCKNSCDASSAMEPLAKGKTGNLTTFHKAYSSKCNLNLGQLQSSPKSNSKVPSFDFHQDSQTTHVAECSYEFGDDLGSFDDVLPTISPDSPLY